MILGFGVLFSVLSIPGVWVVILGCYKLCLLCFRIGDLVCCVWLILRLGLGFNFGCCCIRLVCFVWFAGFVW